MDLPTRIQIGMPAWGEGWETESIWSSLFQNPVMFVNLWDLANVQ